LAGFSFKSGKVVPNRSFNADANTGHAFGILLASVGALRPFGLRRRLTLALGSLQVIDHRHSTTMIKTAFSYIAAPISGSIVGGVFMSVAVPAPAAFFCLMFTLFGAGIAIPATALLGPISLYTARRFNLSLKPFLLLISITASLLALALIQYATKANVIPPVHAAIFAITTAIATSLTFLGINPQESHERSTK